MADNTATVWNRLANRVERLSLRARLLLGLVLVATIGLVVADVVVYNEIESYLLSQLDQELTAVQPQELTIVQSAGGYTVVPLHDANLPADTFIAVYSLNGTSPIATSADAGNTHLVLPSSVQTSLAATVSGSSNGSQAIPSSSERSFFSTNLTSAGSFPAGHYRVLAEVANDNLSGNPAIAVIAIPLRSLDGTLNKLLALDIGVSLIVLAVLGAIGYVVVRIGMRPLAAIEDTADAIAKGDLSLRVERDDDDSEVGRLGAALNVMLARIESAFSEQKASENRLRQFLADASHELRTPVTSIRGYSELFRLGAASRPEDLGLAMRRIEDESLRMGVLVDDLLLLARLDDGRPLEKVTVDIGAVTVDAAADAQVTEPDRAITVDAVGPILVEGDEQRLHQVVANLLDNALRYSTKGEPIDVTLRRDGTKAVLAVSDRGPGIPDDQKELIFERFYRSDPSRTRVSGGSGLGLSIVSSIVGAHRGSVRLESTENGSTFIVELPLKEPDAPTYSPQSSEDRLTISGGQVVEPEPADLLPNAVESDPDTTAPENES